MGAEMSTEGKRIAAEIKARQTAKAHAGRLRKQQTRALGALLADVLAETKEEEPHGL